VLGLLPKRYHTGLGARVGHLADIHAVVEGEGVCIDDGPWSARRSLQTIAMDVCRNC